MPDLYARVRRKVGYAIAPRVAPLARPLRTIRKRCLAILMYHGVTDEQTAIPDWCQVRVEDFRRQAEFLSQEYRVLPLGEAIERLSKGQPLPDRAACLTFDDGFQNVYTNAAPILERYQLPSTVFVVTSLLDGRQPPWPGRLLYALSKTALASIQFEGVDRKLCTGPSGHAVYNRLVSRIKAFPREIRERRVDELVAALGGASMDFSQSPRATMGWKELEELAGRGWMGFESHTHTHPSLANCTEEEQRRELLVSRALLRERVRVEDLFCYPFGDYTPVTMKMVAELGYRCGLTSALGLNGAGRDVYALRRVSIGPELTQPLFEIAMLGWL